MIKVLPNDQIKSKITTTKLLDKVALKNAFGNVANYIFKVQKNLEFLNQSNVWIENDSIISNGVDMQI
jgi:hypothetical protein